MTVMNVLGVEIGGDEYKEEFLAMVADSLKLCQEDSTCQYIEAWQSPAKVHEFMIVSIWNSEQDLLNWYKSPFHLDLRKRGMQGLLKSYFNRQGDLDENKSHQWKRPG